MAPFLAAACNKMHACNDDSAAETLLRVLGEYEHVLPEDAPRRPHVKKEDDEEEEPRYTVWVEGFSIGEAGSLVDALTLWACAFFIFHQKTGRLQKNTCWFMRCYILDLPVEKAVDRNVAKAIQDMVR
ncbi:uncharacterized protein LOC122391114 isoform X2 [Amphibalanus amphitrite]|uniref:uncharacterized protein LOC122384845 n=1 Tax=Amphibalanus amphitrite TaxID=1232801 RepID=UPI001C8FE510|nr:uncharacterized protein LOC122384845 [Amphibalanus amphitrite]XP_043240712.1 uncharacterized protein LOC122391114 isoform X2 [Amphibalanus amphitrite]